MKALYDLKDKLQIELDEIARKPEMGAGDLELVHKLTDTIKNIDKICALEEEGGYSETGDWEGAYNRGSSYSNRGKHYVQGHYSRDGYSRDGRMGGGYSRHDAKERLMEQAQKLMDNATTEREREAVHRLMTELGRD